MSTGIVVAAAYTLYLTVFSGCAVVEGPSFFVDGGLQIDGSIIASIKEEEIIQACKAIVAEVRRSKHMIRLRLLSITI